MVESVLSKIRLRLKLVLPEGSLRQRYAGNTFWSLLGSIISQAATLVTAVIGARMLGRNTFGEYGIVQSTMAMFGLLAGMSLGLTTTKYVSELRDTDKIRCGQVVGLTRVVLLISATIGMIGLFLFASTLANNILKAPHLTPELRISGIILFFSALNGVQIGTLAGFEAFKQIFYVNIFKAITTLIFVTTGILLWALPGMFLGMCCAAGLTFLYTLILEQKIHSNYGIRVVYHGLKNEASILMKFMVPSTISLLLPGIVFWVARTILIQRHPHGYLELGTFTAADQWTIVIVFVSGTVNTAGLPLLSNIYATNDLSRYQRALSSNILLAVGITSLIAGGVAIASPLLTMLYGDSFVGLSPVLIIICGVAIMRSLGGSLGNFIVSINQMWWGVLFNLLWGGSLILFAVLFARKGAIGLAWAYFISYALHSFWGILFFIVKMRLIKLDKVKGQKVFGYIG